MHMDFSPDSPIGEMIEFGDFLNVDIRIGTIISAQEFPKARKPSYRLEIDLGPAIGVRKSSAQITDHYSIEDLPGKQVACVVNFPPRQIANFVSQVLTLGFADKNGQIVLFSPDHPIPNGARLA